MATQKIVIDPVTRIEGHLKMTVEVDDGKIVDAYSSGTMWRGIELILKGRDPRDAGQITQRICGVCPISHGIASSKCLEGAFGIKPNKNGRVLRNLMLVRMGGAAVDLSGWKDILKIDRSFVNGLTTDPDDATIVSTIIAMAHNLKMNVVAEGVETRADFITARELGFDLIQGFFFAKPMEPQKFARRVLGKPVAVPS